MADEGTTKSKVSYHNGVKEKYLLGQSNLPEVLYRCQERDSRCVLRGHPRLFCRCGISVKRVSFSSRNSDDNAPLLSEKRVPTRTLRCP